jgi:hypothetical protein
MIEAEHFAQLNAMWSELTQLSVCPRLQVTLSLPCPEGMWFTCWYALAGVRARRRWRTA